MERWKMIMGCLPWKGRGRRVGVLVSQSKAERASDGRLNVDFKSQKQNLSLCRDVKRKWNSL
jgi:hypothetical protein